MGDQGIIHVQDNVNANLSDTGAIRRLGKRLPKDGLWFSSNLRRTIETAKEISGGLHRLKYRNLPSRILANGMAKNGKSYQKRRWIISGQTIVTKKHRKEKVSASS